MATSPRDGAADAARPDPVRGAPEAAARGAQGAATSRDPAYESQVTGLPRAGEEGAAQAARAELQRIRGSIDNIDAAVVYLLAERFKHTQRVGWLKAEHGMPPADAAREEEQIARLRALAEQAHLDPAFAEKFITFVIDEVIRHHQAIAADTTR